MTAVPLSNSGDASLPLVIQGGMGAGVSHWGLARAVSRLGQLGVVSGTGADTILVRRLQDGDAGGHLRRALATFPIPGAAQWLLTKYYRAGGRPRGRPYPLLPMYDHRASTSRELIAVLANYAEVWLAREGHDHPVGINLLTKIQPPTFASLYGAMLAGVACVLMGAGIPREIPGALDRLARHEPASQRLDLPGSGEPVMLTFDPAALWASMGHDVPAQPLERPKFYAIVSSNLLATMLARKANGRVDGFIVEGPTAGGHNAPPRGELKLNELGEPVYGERDAVDLAALKELGLPFWIAGGTGSPEGLGRALAAGACGIQVGTLFAFCDDSGLAEDHRQAVLRSAGIGTVSVRTDPRASPTGYPFKIVAADDLPTVNGERERVCDLGYLRSAYRREDGGVGFRCPGEPVEQFVKKGGASEETVGRRCLCNALMANIGLGQERPAGAELPLITSGDDLVNIGAFLNGRQRYSAADVLGYLLDPCSPSVSSATAALTPSA